MAAPGDRTTSDRVWYLKRINLFHSFKEETLEKLCNLAVETTYQRGQVILGPDDPGDTIYVLRGGRVKLSRFDDRGKEITLAILEEGEFFGEEALAHGERGNGYAEAVDECLVCQVSRTDFEHILAENPDVALAVARQMSERLLGARSQIEALAFHDVPQRLAGALVQLAERHGHHETSGKVRIHLRVTHQELANLIASTRETTTSLLNRFRRDGLLETEGRFFVLPNIEGLRELARGH